jgi:hypothetical protein
MHDEEIDFGKPASPTEAALKGDKKKKYRHDSKIISMDLERYVKDDSNYSKSRKL